MTTQATQQLIKDLKVLMADAEELAKATATQTGDKLTEVRGKIQRSITELKPRLVQAEIALKERTTAAAATADDYVHARPWSAVGTAACIGLAIGLLIGRR